MAWLQTSDINDKINEQDYHLHTSKETGDEQEWSVQKTLHKVITNSIHSNVQNIMEECNPITSTARKLKDAIQQAAKVQFLEQ